MSGWFQRKREQVDKYRDENLRMKEEQKKQGRAKQQTIPSEVKSETPHVHRVSQQGMRELPIESSIALESLG